VRSARIKSERFCFPGELQYPTSIFRQIATRFATFDSKSSIADRAFSNKKRNATLRRSPWHTIGLFRRVA
jgi:hypothetical protein